MLIGMETTLGSDRASLCGVVLVVHGGAGHLYQEVLSPEIDQASRNGLIAALQTGQRLLDSGADALTVVEAVVATLEDDPLFNAGRGAVFNAAGQNELDASLMCGHTRRAGACAGLTSIKNPIRLARAILERTPHVMAIGDGAEKLAEELGIERVDPSYFYTDARWKQLERAREANEVSLSEDNKFGTVGAVARDKNQHLAAATSTGGMTNKRYGRVGDSPIIGAGTWAEDATCAVSSTGHGEFFLRLGVAHEIAARMRLAQQSLAQAATDVIHDDLRILAGETGSGGVIALDRAGNAALPFNTAGMYRGVLFDDGTIQVAIYREE